MEEGLLRDLESPYAAAVEQSIVGSDSFIDRIKRAYLLGRQGNRREEPSLVHLQQSFSLEEVTEAVAELYRIAPARLSQRRGTHREARRVLMYSKHCRYRLTLTDLAARFGVSVSGLTRARDRVAAELSRNRQLRQRLRDIDQRLVSSESQ